MSINLWREWEGRMTMNQIALQDRTDELYDRVRHLVPEMEWETFVEDIRAIEA